VISSALRIPFTGQAERPDRPLRGLRQLGVGALMLQHLAEHALKLQPDITRLIGRCCHHVNKPGGILSRQARSLLGAHSATIATCVSLPHIIHGERKPGPDQPDSVNTTGTITTPVSE
jgi:hypothetical protein